MKNLILIVEDTDMNRSLLADMLGPVSYTHLDVYKRQEHPHPGAQDGHESQLAPRNHLGLGQGDGGFDLHLLERKVAGGLEAHQHLSLIHI